MIYTYVSYLLLTWNNYKFVIHSGFLILFSKQFYYSEFCVHIFLFENVISVDYKKIQIHNISQSRIARWILKNSKMKIESALILFSSCWNLFYISLKFHWNIMRVYFRMEICVITMFAIDFPYAGVIEKWGGKWKGK